MPDDGATTSAVERTPSGVRPPTPPAVRWDPGARYRPSRLTAPAHCLETRAQTLPAGAAPGALSPAGAGQDARTAPAHLPGRLFRGPARRRAVFERDLWQPAPPRSLARSAALAEAVDRYRLGVLDTTGLVRAVGHVLAA
ncbi:hypothetical protein DNL40_10625 [Xylanimonas oleitrophica]|uniref:Uncharacterized protein n=1 Tax=Xylanimonas oleitrophica TaxID=2607479 RepID=A0A2W5WWX3_9MICO|nr:hypothetical protein [Xylanimonas oleitrophica]PZR52806.1 hypothetical protein DNL40_10625 [Xylanimonas oleitrophica]